MGRNSRSRQVQQKKKETAKPAPSGVPREEDSESSGGGGSLMNMRAGFKNIAGTGEGEAKGGGKTSLVTWALLALVVVALISFLMSR